MGIFLLYPFRHQYKYQDTIVEKMVVLFHFGSIGFYIHPFLYQMAVVQIDT